MKNIKNEVKVVYVTRIEKKAEKRAEIVEVEVWKDIENYIGLYQVSNLGRVRSLDRVIETTNNQKRKYKGKIISQTNDKDGYKLVGLSNENNRRTHRVHRLVASAFIKNPENKPEVNHKNGIVDDNRLENLEWVTSLENTRHALENGLTKQNGEDSVNAKLTNEQAQEIRDLIKEKKYKQYEIAEMYGVSKSVISNIKNNKRYIC